MTSRSNTKGQYQPPKYGNPYEILGLGDPTTQTITTSQIKKAHRELSLLYHPDKRSNNNNNDSKTKSLTDEQLNQKFIAVQEARSFLLDPEHAHDKEIYDLQLASEANRKRNNAQREEQMTSQRKRMRDELRDKLKREENEKYHSSKKKKESDTTFTTTSSTETRTREEMVRDLKHKSEQLKEQYHQQQQKQEYRHKQQHHHLNHSNLQKRQIRLKWSRAKIGHTQTPDTIRSILEPQFGPIETVEFIGKKGNAALVTFTHESSCKLCVDAYLTSDEMRASYCSPNDTTTTTQSNATTATMTQEEDYHRERESIQERKLRQAAEREKLLRQMEMEDGDKENQEHDDVGYKHPSLSSSFVHTDPTTHDTTSTTNVVQGNIHKSTVLSSNPNDKSATTANNANTSTKVDPNQTLNVFPPHFPSMVSFFINDENTSTTTTSNNNATSTNNDNVIVHPIDKLEFMERELLKYKITPERLQQMQVNFFTTR